MSYVYESADSPELSVSINQTGSSAKLRYIVLETTSSSTAISLVSAEAPPSMVVNGELLIRQTFKPKIEGHDTWFVDVNYGPEDSKKSQEQPEAGMWKFSVDTTGGTHDLKQAIEEVWRGERSSTNPAPDLAGAIGYDGKEVKGVSVPVPLLRFTITAYYPPETITDEWWKEVSRATGKTNSEPWLCFGDCELLFMGGRGDGDFPTLAGPRTKPIAVQLLFDASENIDEPFMVGDIEVPSKKGWHHLDVKYEEVEDAGVVFMTAVHARVYKIFKEVEFAAIFGFGAPEEE